MKKLYVILLFAGVTFVGSIQAQVFNSRQDSIINAEVKQLVSNYEYYGVLTENDRSISQDMLFSFKKLFTPNATIYNDLMKDKPKMMSIDNYLRAIIEYYPAGLGLTVKITEIGKAEYESASGKYKVPVKISKDVFGTDKRGNLIDMTNVENQMFIVFNKSLKSFKISEINKKQLSFVSLILTFIDVDKSKPVGGIKAMLMYDGKVMQTKISNKAGKVVFNKIPDKKRVSIQLDKEGKYTTSSKITDKLVSKWATSEPEKRQVYLKREKKWQNIGVEIVAGLASSSINMNITQNNYDATSIVNDGNFVVNGGVNFSYYFKSNKKSALGIKTGLHFDSYSTDMGSNDYNQDEIPNMTDSEHDTYNLIVSANNVADKVSLSYIGIPIMLNYRAWINNSFLNYIYAGGGFATSFLLNGTSTLKGSASYSGYYPEWDITLKDVDYLNFYDNKSFDSKSDLNIKSLMFSAIVTAGVSIPLKKPEFSVVVAFDFGYSLNNISNYNAQNYYLSPEQQNYNSLAGSSDKMKPMSWGFHIGVHYDLFK